MPDPRDTPAMRQYARFKARHPDCVLLFRIGDFYEMFDDDAVRVSKAIGLTLTQRTEGVPMCGVPYHQVEVYLRKLIAQGFRVAVCEQVQDAREAKGIVERAVTRVLTPGTLVDESLLEDGAANTLVAVSLPLMLSGKAEARVGVAVVELSTGAFTVLECTTASLLDELARRGINELLYPEPSAGAPVPPPVKAVADAIGLSCTARPGWQFRPREATEAVLEQYGVATLAGFGLSEEDPALPAAGAIIRYLRETQTVSPDDAPSPSSRRATLAHLRPPRREDSGGTCMLDAVSLRSLEIEQTMRGGQLEGSLLGLFLGHGGPAAGCRTAMGKRLVREWLRRPLSRLDEIRARHHAVATLVEDRRTAASLVASLEGVQDVARIAGRIALGRATPRDLVALGRSLSRLDLIADAIHNAPAFKPHAGVLAQVRSVLEPLAARILADCVQEPPHHLREGGLFKDGVDPELDSARLLQRDGSSWLVQYQQRLIEEHKLPGIKVGYNKVFGYYIELTAAQARQAPAVFSRKQTLKNAERYITPELKEFEEKATTAEARAVERERQMFDALCDRAAKLIGPIGEFAHASAELDVLSCFADRAVRRGWVRPEMVEGPVLHLRAARHPVLEIVLGDSFVPNDVELGGEGVTNSRGGEATASEDDHEPSSAPASLRRSATPSPSLALITGPNMAGKSTFIRQTALIVLLAHAGSFVPAEAATIGVTDRIFTRVGADDALHAGQSTFMVEMTETANILHHATGRSLVILDEIGRGTSTLDGLSLAWAIAEYLAGGGGAGEERSDEAQEVRGGTGAHSAPSPRRAAAPPLPPRTLFATHYHELTDLEERLPGRVRNFHVAVREWGEQIVFLHRILPGRTDRSYGVHVAKLAGIPTPVIARAREVLESLSVQHAAAASHAQAIPETGTRGRSTDRAGVAPPSGQLSLFTEYVPHPAVDDLRRIDVNALSPLQAFDALRSLVEAVRQNDR